MPLNLSLEHLEAKEVVVLRPFLDEHVLPCSQDEHGIKPEQQAAEVEPKS